MAEIWVMGELLVEIMRTEEDIPLYEPGVFKGPFPSGAPAIFIDTAARLGHTTGIIGGVGNDDFGRCLLNRLHTDGVDISQVLTDDKISTGCAFVTYFSDGSRKFIYHIGNTPAAKAKAPVADVLGGIQYFHVMGCSLFADLAFAKEILKAAQLSIQLGAQVSFDPNIRRELMGNTETLEIVEEILNLTSVFLPGEEELLLLTRTDKVEEAIERCFEKPRLKILALKQGSKGCTVYTRESRIQGGVYRVQTVDATGAGDSFDGAFISALVEGRTLEDTMKMASAAGALNTAAFGPMEGQISKQMIEDMVGKEELK